MREREMCVWVCMCVHMSYACVCAGTEEYDNTKGVHKVTVSRTERERERGREREEVERCVCVYEYVDE